jgi:hypothetical protein
MEMERVVRKPKLLRALSSLEPGEFERLLGLFEAQLATQRSKQTWDGQERQRAPGAGNLGALPTTRTKLFFLLFSLQVLPLAGSHGLAL